MRLNTNAAKAQGEVLGADERQHARVETDIACTVDGATEGRIRNLSQGGALLSAPAGLADIDETVSLSFQIGEAEPLTVFGEVVRIRQAGTQAEFGIEFVAIEPEQAAKLVRCIDLLVSGKGLGSRQAPRVFRRLELKCRNAEEFYATMRDISRGGVGLQCPVPLAVGEEVAVELLAGPLESTLQLSGVVAHVHPEEGGLHRVGLRFGRLSAKQQQRLDELLRWMIHGGSK